MIQQISLQPQGTIPPDATTLAATHRLGTPVARYKNRFVGVVFGAFLWACIGILLMLTILSGFNLTDLILALMGLLLICYAIVRFSKALTNRGTSFTSLTYSPVYFTTCTSTSLNLGNYLLQGIYYVSSQVSLKLGSA